MKPTATHVAIMFIIALAFIFGILLAADIVRMSIKESGIRHQQRINDAFDAIDQKLKP